MQFYFLIKCFIFDFFFPRKIYIAALYTYTETPCKNIARNYIRNTQIKNIRTSIYHVACRNTITTIKYFWKEMIQKRMLIFTVFWRENCSLCQKKNMMSFRKKNSVKTENASRQNLTPLRMNALEISRPIKFTSIYRTIPSKVKLLISSLSTRDQT